MCKKICPIAVRFSFEESELIKQHAAEEGCSVSSYIRDRIRLDELSPKNQGCRYGRCDELRLVLILLYVQNIPQADLERLQINADDIAKMRGYMDEVLAQSVKDCLIRLSD